MLDRLRDYARLKGLPVEPGFTPKRILWAIKCREDGSYVGVLPLGQGAAKNKKDRGKQGKSFPKTPSLSQPEIVGGPPGCRHFLADSAEVVALVGVEVPTDKQLLKHGYFKRQLAEAAQEAPILKGLAETLENNLERIKQDLAAAGAKSNELVTFRKGKTFPVSDEACHAWWRRFYGELTSGSALEVEMLDLLTGQPCRPARTHPKIGLAAVGGQPTGDALVSFDKDAFTSYGLEQSANAAFSPQSAKEYADALNHLIHHQGKVMAGLMITYWFVQDLPPGEDPLALALDPESFARQQEVHDKQVLDRARQLLEAIEKGERPRLLANRYHALTLSGAAGRAMVRDWMEGSFEELVRAVLAWFEDLAIVHRQGGVLAPEPKLWAVLGATVRDLDEIKPPHVAGLWRAAITNSPIPRWALARTLMRVRADVVRGDAPRHARLGLIKAYLKRCPNRKGGDELQTHLNENHPEPAYHCGRLMAVYASLQYAALGDVGAGVVQRYYAAASTTPALILGRLAKLSQFHLNKLKGGLSRWFESLLAGVWSQLGDRLPATLTLEEQGLFALGYYQQMAELRTKKTADGDDADQTDETTSDDKE